MRGGPIAQGGTIYERSPMDYHALGLLPPTMEVLDGGSSGALTPPADSGKLRDSLTLHAGVRPMSAVESEPTSSSPAALTPQSVRVLFRTWESMASHVRQQRAAQESDVRLWLALGEDHLSGQSHSRWSERAGRLRGLFDGVSLTRWQLLGPPADHLFDVLATEAPLAMSLLLKRREYVPNYDRNEQDRAYLLAVYG